MILSQSNLIDGDINNINENGDAEEKVTVKEVRQITSAELYEVHNTNREVITAFDDSGRGIQKIVPNGTLENIQEYATIEFGTDTDQQIAFTQLVAAFVVKLHEKASFNEFFYEKKHNNGKIEYDFNKPIPAWIRQGTVDHVGTIVDEAVISKLRDLQESHDGIDFTILDRLDLPTDFKVQIKWDQRNYTQLVPWNVVRLIGALGSVRSTRDHHLQKLQ